MQTLPMRAVFTTAIVATLIAAVAVALFHLIVTEPVIEQAITMEEQLHASDVMHEEPIVSRDAQHIGLIVGFLIYGMTWGLLFAVVYTLAQHKLPGATPAERGIVLAVLGYLAIGLLPFIKYPANPPGVGEPESIGFRQAFYIVVLLLSVASAAGSLALGRILARGRSAAQVSLVIAALFVAFGLAVYFVLPVSPDEIRLPAQLIAEFRLRSIVGVTIFWVVLGAVFARRAQALAADTGPRVAPVLPWAGNDGRP